MDVGLRTTALAEVERQTGRPLWTWELGQEPKVQEEYDGTPDFYDGKEFGDRSRRKMKT